MDKKIPPANKKYFAQVRPVITAKDPYLANLLEQVNYNITYRVG